MALRVLIVDDEPLVRETVAAMLAELKLEPYMAEDATQAMALCDQLAPNVAIIDLVLPGPVDGIKLINDMIAKVPLCKIIATSGDPESDSYFRALRLHGVVHQLPKPISMGALAKVISAATGIHLEDLGEDLIG